MALLGLVASRRSAVGHNLIEFVLSTFMVSYVFEFQHFALIFHHLGNFYRVVAAVIWAVMINRAAVLILW